MKAEIELLNNQREIKKCELKIIYYKTGGRKYNAAQTKRSELRRKFKNIKADIAYIEGVIAALGT